MIGINPTREVEDKLRALSDALGESLNTVVCGLVNLGLRGRKEEIQKAISAAARPMGRPAEKGPKAVATPEVKKEMWRQIRKMVGK